MKKKILKVILNLLMIGVIFSGLTFGVIWDMNERITLIHEVISLEYGESYNPTIENLIDLEKFHYINLQDVQIESNIYNEVDKDYPGVGEYKIYIYYKNKTLEQRVQVKDTIAPEVIIKNAIEIKCNTDLSTVDLLNYIELYDLSPLKEYKIELLEIDTSVIGQYETTISIEDIYGNKTEKNLIIKIIENIKENVEEVTEEKNGEVAEKTTTTKNNKTPTISKTTNNDKKPESNTSKNTNTNISTNNNTNKQSESKKDTTNSERKENTSNSSNVENTNSSDNTNDKKEEIKKEEPKEVSKCTHTNENYYNSESEAIAVYKNKTKELGSKVKNGEITYDEYIKLCPYGYETMSCPYCGKWTISFYYKYN